MEKLLDTHLLESGAPSHLRELVMNLARAAKYISYYIKTGDLSIAETSNASGEDQLALDVAADKIITDNLSICRLVASAASEEKQREIECSHDNHEQRYSISFDPLDGSSVLDANLAVGSVFSIYPDKGFLGRSGREQVAALYVLYGPRTTIVYTIGKGTHEFVLNDVGEFVMSQENIKIENSSKHFAPGNLRGAIAGSDYRRLLEDYIDEGQTLRYSGSMTADISHLLNKKGGMFTYPAAGEKYPDGKLRLLFECNPFAFLIEQAGGKASSGKMNVMDIEITDIHQRTPIFIGSSEAVDKAVSYFE